MPIFLCILLAEACAKQDYSALCGRLGRVSPLRYAGRWAECVVNTESLLASRAVCNAGLNTVPFPGDIRSPSILESSTDVALFCVNLFHRPITPFRRELGGSVRTQQPATSPLTRGSRPASIRCLS